MTSSSGRVKRFVLIPLVLVAVAAGFSEAGNRRARRELWCSCYLANWGFQTCGPAQATIPSVPDHTIHAFGASSERVRPASESPVSAEARAAAVASNTFAFDLYHRLCEKEGDRFFSPFSVSMGLALLSHGATGDTQRQILNVAHLDPARPETSRGYAELRDRLMSTGKGPQVRLANRLWVQTGFPLDPEFRKSAHNFGAEPGEVDFKDLPAARETINRWGFETTAGRIRELLPPQFPSDGTRFILTGGIHFKGTWKYQFDRAATTEAPFHVTAERDVKVRMMQQTGALNYAETDELQILELPYSGGNLAMVVLLPKKVDGLTGVEAKLSADAVSKWLAGTHGEGEVEVHLPRFTFAIDVALKSELSALGMPRAFSDEAEFPAIATDHGQKLNEAVQQAFVDVNEEGTEAAAVFGFIGGNAPSPVPRHILFKADHPFVFLIHDVRSGAILFLGRVVEPAG
ncbi:MAG: serpin family protein [Planctomycetes bacterium]|nr:serpin family protein [Planctomycetota bacterium]